jgi:hypothetical protein
LCAAPPPRRASASSPPLPHPPEVVSDAVTHRVRASVGLEALDFQPPGARRVSTGAGPQAGPGWRTARRASPRTRPDAPPPRPASARPSESRAPPCHDIDQLGCRLRYRDLREAGVSEVLRQLPQFANGAHLHALDGPALRSATPAALLCRDCGSRRCACCRPDPRRPGSTLALARVGEQPPSSTPTSLPVRTSSDSAALARASTTALAGEGRAAGIARASVVAAVLHMHRDVGGCSTHTTN